MLHAVIMAGGSGTRFWPASRSSMPKQLLDLAGDRTMIQQTVDRLAGLTDSGNVMIITNQNQLDTIAQQLPALSTDSLIGEPCKRDTAPCVGLAASLVHAKDPDAVMAVMPADHVIHPAEEFQRALQHAADLVTADPERIVTFGIRPSYAAESFGYIERGNPLTDNQTDIPSFAVSRFREKPSQTVAQQYLESGNYYWDAGIFVWKAQTILDALAKYEPQMRQHLQTIAESLGTDQYHDTLQTEFAAIEGKSIDYAVMEHYDNAVVVEAPFQWDDVGSWQSLARLRGTDDHGNTLVGKHLEIRTEGSIVKTSDDHLVVTLGMKDCIVVHTENATLVANKHDEEAIREVVAQLKEKNWKEYL